jgi:hypothetical protein
VLLPSLPLSTSAHQAVQELSQEASELLVLHEHFLLVLRNASFLAADGASPIGSIDEAVRQVAGLFIMEVGIVILSSYVVLTRTLGRRRSLTCISGFVLHSLILFVCFVQCSPVQNGHSSSSDVRPQVMKVPRLIPRYSRERVGASSPMTAQIACLGQLLIVRPRQRRRRHRPLV